MSEILLRNLALLDPHAGELLSGYEVLLRDKEIVAVEKGTIHALGAEVHDLGGSHADARSDRLPRPPEPHDPTDRAADVAVASDCSCGCHAQGHA